MISVRKILKTEHDTAQAFYSSVGYTNNIVDSDQVVVAELERKIIGIGRVSVEHGHYVLRGMQIEKAYQNKKIGTQILSELSNIISQEECYCIPYAWLEEFYEKIKFKQVSENIAPKFLQERICNYKTKGYNVIMMKRLIS